SRQVVTMNHEAVDNRKQGVSIVKTSETSMKKRLLIALNTPYGVMSQFTAAQHPPTLGDYLQVPHVYPAGRLDKDSEGLILLTNDGRLQERIAHPHFKIEKTYWAQVEGTPEE